MSTFQEAFDAVKPSTDKMLAEYLDDHKAPKEVRSSPLGCRNCLWSSIECSFGSKYQATEKVDYGKKKVATCKAYTYYN